MVEAAGGYAGTYYYHFDALGSVVALSDAAGDTVQVYEYDVYGQVAASDPNHPNRFLFTGREFDTETGLYYYRARYYNASIGRFLQTDPIGYADGMNWYAYCRNNSINRGDPSGCKSTVGYYFLPLNHSQIAIGPNGEALLTFAQVADGVLTVLWSGSTIEDWMGWARVTFSDEDWKSERAGYELAGGNDDLFWWIQALCFVGASECVTTIEACDLIDVTITINHQWNDEWGGYNGYDSGTHTVYWNPDWWCYGQSQEGLGAISPRHWHVMHPLMGLAHELRHAADDAVIHNWKAKGISMSLSRHDAEINAMNSENSARAQFRATVPGFHIFYPRPGYLYESYDIGDTAEEAWSNMESRHCPKWYTGEYSYQDIP